MYDGAKNAEACANCTGEPERYAHGAHGYCVRCYGLMRRIKETQAWNRDRPETLKRIAKNWLAGRAITDEEFEICRQEHIRQLTHRLALLRHREEIRRCEVSVDALELEHKFGQLLRLVRRKAQYPHHASYINENFNENERRVIYALLEEIIEQVPWRGIRWYPMERAISEHRNARSERKQDRWEAPSPIASADHQET
jgi:hypothetical protein